MKAFKNLYIVVILLMCIFLVSCSADTENAQIVNENTVSISDIPEFSNEPYVVVNDNIPVFDEEHFQKESFEVYSELDSLGRCGIAYANVGIELMPTEDRGSIGQIKPSGWQTVRYDNVDGGYLYNRCHLLGYQLTGENANEKNLITGTRYMNVDGMLPFEDMVADYIKETNNHVLYRVTPIYEGNNLLASGVQMEGESVEDRGEAISFNVYVYNNQPGIIIDYATGKSKFSESEIVTSETGDNKYIINTNSGKFHKYNCSGVKTMNEENKEEYTGDRQELLNKGYDACGLCNP